MSRKKSNSEGAAVEDPVGGLPEGYSEAPDSATPAKDGEADKKEPKDRKFIRLANQRVNAALKRIRHIRSLSNRSSYSYSRDQSQEIVNALKLAVIEVETAFDAQKKEEGFFSLGMGR